MDKALCFVLEGFDGAIVPPVCEVAGLVVVTSHGIESWLIQLRYIHAFLTRLTVRELMSTHRSERTVAQVLRYAWVVEDGSLHNAGRKHYLIASWVVIRLMRVSDGHRWRQHACIWLKTTNIDSICRHSPFITIRRFTQSRPFALYGKSGNGKGVSEEGRARDVHRCIVFFKGRRVANIWALRGIAYFLYDVVN